MATQVSSHAQNFFKRMESKKQSKKPSINDIMTSPNTSSLISGHFKSNHELLTHHNNLMASTFCYKVIPIRNVNHQNNKI